jgi:transcriptional regulator with XRE-family HTH domain
MNALSRLWQKLSMSKKYREAFVAAHCKKALPIQVSAMRRKLGWSQAQLAKASGLTQGVISRAEDSEYGNLTFNTILRIAGGLDVAFIARFVPFSEFARWVENFSEENVQVATLEEELAREQQQRPEIQAGEQAAAITAGRLVPLMEIQAVTESVARPTVQLPEVSRNMMRNFDSRYGTTETFAMMH